ncbi:MAG TPA: GNAT family N-acetyltransferase [Actinomycetales bacterium]|nr:GNAT family N-acetyltransferase [Actinomycetales bacterium]
MTPSRPPVELRTNRLRLRQWREDDRDRFAALNADPRVMEFFPAPLDPAGSDAMLDRLRADVAARGWGLWAVEVVDGGALAGFVGLAPVGADLPPAPGVEVGWRLAHEHWGRGYAAEAATEVLRFAFEDLALPEVVSFTTVGNTKSRRVMQKIGLVHDPERDFDHPRTPGWRGQRHVLYALRRDAWLSRSSGRSAGDR